MEIYLKACGGVLIAVVLWLCVNRQGKDISLVITVAVCCMVILAAVSYLRPVINFFQKLQSVGNLNKEYVEVILKTLGIALLSELCAMICKDAGNESMGKAVQILATGVILWLSLPVFERLLSLVETILGKV